MGLQSPPNFFFLAGLAEFFAQSGLVCRSARHLATNEMSKLSMKFGTDLFSLRCNTDCGVLLDILRIFTRFIIRLLW